jgi:hypothetical protein
MEEGHMLSLDEPYIVQCRVCLYKKTSFHAILLVSVPLACFWQAHLAGGESECEAASLSDGMTRNNLGGGQKWI